MNKQELADRIIGLALDEEMETLILDLIEASPEVDKFLLDTIADTLDVQAKFFEEAADILEEEAEEYNVLESELEALDAEEELAKLEAYNKSQEELLEEFKRESDGLKAEISSQSTAQDNHEIDQIKQSLQAHVQAASADSS